MSVGFLLIRHGRVDYDAYPGRFRGHGIDLLPLMEQGRAEAEALASKLEGSNVSLILASPMARALQTAMIVSWRLVGHVEVELDLHEWVPDQTQSWQGGEIPMDAYEDLVRHGGEWPEGERRAWEPHSAVRSRVGAVLRRYESVDGTIAVICHSGVIEAMTGAAHTPPCGIVAWP